MIELVSQLSKGNPRFALFRRGLFVFVVFVSLTQIVVILPLMLPTFSSYKVLAMQSSVSFDKFINRVVIIAITVVAVAVVSSCLSDDSSDLTVATLLRFDWYYYCFFLLLLSYF